MVAFLPAKPFHEVPPVALADDVEVRPGAAGQDIPIARAAGKGVVAAAAIKGVTAFPAFEPVVAAVPGDEIVAGAVIGPVIAACCLDAVIPGAPGELLGRIGADQKVSPGAAPGAAPEGRGLRGVEGFRLGPGGGSGMRHPGRVRVEGAVGGSDEGAFRAGGAEEPSRIALRRLARSCSFLPPGPRALRSARLGWLSPNR